MGRALRTKETMPDFREECRVTRRSRIFGGLTGSQQTPGFWGVTVSFLLQWMVVRSLPSTFSFTIT